MEPFGGRQHHDSIIPRRLSDEPFYPRSAGAFFIRFNPEVERLAPLFYLKQPIAYRESHQNHRYS